LFRTPGNSGKSPAGFTENVADVNGVRIHYAIGGKVSPVVLCMATPKPATCGIRFKNFERDAKDFAE